MANLSPMMAMPREAEVQGQNAKPLRNAGVVVAAESGCRCRFGAARVREIQTLSRAESQLSVMARTQRSTEPFSVSHQRLVQGRTEGDGQRDHGRSHFMCVVGAEGHVQSQVAFSLIGPRQSLPSLRSS